MTVQTHRFRPLSVRRRLVFALAAVVHLLAIVIGPVVEATAERESVVHVEEAGTSTHHAHTETTCIVCAAQPLLANGGPAAYRFDASVLRAVVPAAFVLPAPQSATGSPVGSRAPPIAA
jgi:hypothetical protein